jgi:hypothetical protein
MIENTCSIGFGSDLDDEAVASTSMRGGMGQYFFARRNGAEDTKFAYRNTVGLKQQSLKASLQIRC